MSFEQKRVEYSRHPIKVVEFDLDYCSNTHGVAPCTASETGDNKCFNTFHTCNDIPNYTATGVSSGEQTISVDSGAKTFTRSLGSFLDDGFVVGHTVTSQNMTESANDQDELLISAVTALIMTFSTATGLVTDTGDGDEIITLNAIKTYRHCTDVSPHPIGINAIPDVTSINISPAVVDIKGGLGVRSNVSITFKDHPSSDIGIDKYLTDRTYDPLTRSVYGVKLRARNPNYQFRNLRVLSAYLNADGSYEVSNAQPRFYVIDKLNATKGSWNITGKDPLKMASNRKAQVPIPNSGTLSGGIPISALAATLAPSGIGDLEYAASGHLIIKSEVMSFTRIADVLTIVRAQKNTTATNHSSGDTIQQCYVKNAKVDVIAADLLTNFVNTDSAFIPTSTWDAETDANLPGLLDGIIVKPIDVSKALIELAEAAPHFLWWDERTQLIQLTAFKAPPPTATVLNESDHLIQNSVSVKDIPDMRASTIFINYGEFDPTKKLDEPGNLQQSYVRIDTDSIAKYKSNQIKTINSRWININNKALAVSLAALYGRRFSNTPRGISFSLDAKDADVWVGQNRSINHKDIVDGTGLPLDTIFQLVSVKEAKNYDYQGIEFAYGDAITGDPPGGDVVYISESQNVNLKDLYETNFGSITGEDIVATFIVEAGVKIGSSSIGTDALETDDWSSANSYVITLQLDSIGFVVGKGGNGESGDGTPVAQAGGDAINMGADLTLVNNGTIGGGGGGGDSASDAFAECGGGGGAGNDIGDRGLDTHYSGTDLNFLTNPTGGALLDGGDGAVISHNDTGDVVIVTAGKGGNLGGAGGSGGGAAGAAIKKNGFTLTLTVSGDIRGSVS